MLNIYTFIYQFQVATICTQADVKLLSCTSIEVNRQEAEAATIFSSPEPLGSQGELIGWP